MWTDLDKILEFLDNQSVGAFLGALVAFGLVMLTDWARNRRKAKNLVLEVESARFHADQKRQSIVALRDDIRQRNRLSAGQFIRFNSASIRRMENDVLDHLTAEERRALDAIAFRMDGCDQLLDEAHVHSKMLADPRFQTGRNEKATEVLNALEDAIVNLGILIEMCQQYEQKQFSAILNAQHDRTKYEVPPPAP